MVSLFSCDHASAAVRCFVRPFAIDVPLYIYTRVGTHASSMMNATRQNSIKLFVTGQVPPQIE